MPTHFRQTIRDHVKAVLSAHYADSDIRLSPRLAAIDLPSAVIWIQGEQIEASAKDYNDPAKTRLSRLVTVTVSLLEQRDMVALEQKAHDVEVGLSGLPGMHHAEGYLYRPIRQVAFGVADEEAANEYLECAMTFDVHVDALSDDPSDKVI